MSGPFRMTVPHLRPQTIICCENVFLFSFNHDPPPPPTIYRKKHLEALEQLLSKREYRALQQHVQVNSFVKSPQICKELNNTLKHWRHEADSSTLRNLL